MISFLTLLGVFGRACAGLIRAPESRALPGLVVVVLAIGTVFYSGAEGWSLLDALYFSVTTLTTVGLGDLTPDTTAGKVFTIAYLIVGLGVLVAFVTAIGDELLRERRERLARRKPHEHQPGRG